jgi:mannose-6-phosphate isomerase-like protein (cupin superfamily)
VRTHLSPSTVSRIETGKRTLTIDVLAALAAALQVDVATVLSPPGDGEDDVVIRPIAAPGWPGATVWPLSRPESRWTACKVELRPVDTPPDTRVHPGHDWFFVLTGRVELTLGERTVVVAAGEAAEFATMTPHAVRALGGPAELMMLFDADGTRAHRH